MKNKIFKTFPALCAALLLTGGLSVTAFAQTPDTDVTDDSGVVYEEQPAEETVTEETEPLTPDGNATLVDDFGGNKQLITVTTQNGNYFYILIDRDDEGENTVHFLNQVDEADLMALIEDESNAAEETPAVCTCTEKCEAGSVNTACAVCSIDLTDCTGKEAEPETEEPEAEPEEESSSLGGLALFLIIALLGGGGALYYVKVLKPKQSVKGGTDLDDFDFEDYEDEPEAENEESGKQEDESE